MNVKLMVMRGRPAGKELTFAPGKYYLGRGEECHVRFNSDWVSRQHCLLQVTGEQAILTDLGSRNGTLVNGHLLVQEWSLSDGDQIHIGPILFQVLLECPETASEEVIPTMISTLDADLPESEIPLDSTAHQPALPTRPPDPPT